MAVATELTCLNTVYNENFYDMYLAYAYKIEPRFLSYYALHSDLKQLTIFTDSDLYPSSTYVATLAGLQQMPLYEKIENSFQPHWVVEEHTAKKGEKEGKKLLSVRRMMSSPKYPAINYLYMEVDYDAFFAPFAHIIPRQYGIAVKNTQGEVLFTNDYFDQGFLDFTNGNKEAYVSLSTTYELGEVQFFCPKSEIFAGIRNVLRFTLFGFWLMLIILGALGFILSAMLVKPIEKLTKNMLEVEEGELEVTVSTTRKDEVGLLIQGFGHMIARLKHLIEVVYTTQLEKKEYELKLLYAQINPHFLYNVLSLINSQAIMNGQEDISRLALLITTFYRTSLNHGKDEITIEEELKNIVSYVKIQQSLHQDTFDFSIETDPALAPMLIPHFILQPLVENAIEHGLLHSQKESKYLKITLSSRGSRLVFTISDNGTGIDQEELKNLLTQKGKGYGLTNINKRLALVYGKAYLIQIRSKPGKGTSISLFLPKAFPKEADTV